ncbi:hypothetical protein [Allocatelliglobosispora scoriae]|uniref:hypothetical protein n=1 Tax=Allocatelliglobosispora scoriae TaxID=643052 RepID=UPI001C875404|nr:hypothetical protein [Allocatelliglobosispora scoriae]
MGPLPSSVYWRRRAVVLGTALFAVLLVFYSCSGSTKSDASGNPTQGPPKATVTGIISTAAAVSPSPQPSEQVAPSPSVAPSTVTSSAPVVGGDPKLCGDEELGVTAKASPASTAKGGTTILYLYVKNIGSRTCTRDIGPDLQELWIVKGTERVWSSDDCDAPRGTNLKSFNQGLEMSFNVAWNGRYSTTCTKTSPKHAGGDVAVAGNTYRLYARVGTKISAPVKITIR